MNKRLIAAVVAAAAVCALLSVSAVSADIVMFSGQINDSAGNGIPGAKVEIVRGAYKWTATTFGSSMLNMTGVFGTTERVRVPSRVGQYELWIDGNFAESKWLADSDFKKIIDYHGIPVWVGKWYYPPGNWEIEEIPEFSTIAIPIAAIIGLLFFFNRKNKGK